MKNMNAMMKQAQKLQKKMLKTQQEMALKTVEASAGGGMVKVVDRRLNPLLLKRKWWTRKILRCCRTLLSPQSTMP
jgi:hypothetical protein